MPFPLTSQQEAVVEAVRRNDCDIQVTARAGSGKTTVILAAAAVAQGKVGLFAFNKAIAAEIQSKASPNVTVQTLHSLGMRCLSRQFQNVKVDADYTYGMVKSHLQKQEWTLISPTLKLISLVKNNFILNPANEVLDRLRDEYDVEMDAHLTDRVFNLVRRVLNDSIPDELGTSITIDFDDMIYLPSYLALKTVPRFDWVFIDEAQDLNPAQMELIQMVARHGRVCYVGDPAQAIYAWRGSDEYAMPRLRSTLERMQRRVIDLPLTVTQRCPRSVVAFANQYVKDIECAPNAPHGVVRTTEHLDALAGDLVLCRTNAPLVRPAFRLLRRGVTVKIQGRDIGAGLHAVIKRLRPKSVPHLYERLVEYSRKEAAGIKLRYSNQPSREEAALQFLDDKVQTLKALASEQATIEGLSASIDRIFADVSDHANLVLFSTVHKAKGMEAPRVWVIDGTWMNSSQEDNVRYVAITRAMHELVLVHVPYKNQEGKKPKKPWLSAPLAIISNPKAS